MNMDTDEQGELHATTESEIGGTLPQAEGCQGLLAAPGSREGKERPSPRAFCRSPVL